MIIFMKLILFCKATDACKLKSIDIEMHVFALHTLAFPTSITMRHGFEGAPSLKTLATKSKCWITFHT